MLVTHLNMFVVVALQYCDKYGDNVGFPRLEEWRKGLCITALVRADIDLETYRDSWDDDQQLLQQALQSPHFTQLGLEDSPPQSKV